MAWFIGEDVGLRRIPLARLPEHEPAFAMTVHKSQGSEFDNCYSFYRKESPLTDRKELLFPEEERFICEVETEPSLHSDVAVRVASAT